MLNSIIKSAFLRFFMYERYKKTQQIIDTHMATVMCYMFFCPFLAFDFMVGL